MNPKGLAFLILFAAAAERAGQMDTSRCLVALERADFAAAAREAESLLRANPRSADALTFLARAEIGANNAPAAMTHLRRALEIEPKHLDALYYLSKLAAVLSQQQLGYVVEHASDSARAHQIRAEILFAQDKTEDAEREYLAALEKRPGTPAILIALGDLKRHGHEYNEALAWYLKAVEKAPGSYDAVYGAGASHWFLREREEAAQYFRRALEIDPSSMAARLALGEALLALGKYNDSLLLLEQAGKADPNFRRLQFLLARAYKAVGRLEESKRAEERYRELALREEMSEEEDFALRQKQ